MAELPLGCKFMPTDEEMLTYLDNKVNDLKQPNVKLDLVKELDLYHSSPADHQGLSKEECTYIFATRVARYDSSRISNRRTRDGKGSWRLSVGSKKFQLGTKTTLTYYLKPRNKRSKDKRTDWVMHEYALGPADPKMKVHETKVLCRIMNRKQNHQVTEMKQESDSPPTKDGTGLDKSGVKSMMSKSSQEYEQNTAAPANEEIVCTNLGTDGKESSQGYDLQQNTAALANEEIVCTNLGTDGKVSSQGYDPQQNTTSTEKNGLDLSLKL